MTITLLQEKWNQKGTKKVLFLFVLVPSSFASLPRRWGREGTKGTFKKTILKTPILFENFKIIFLYNFPKKSTFLKNYIVKVLVL